MVRYYGWYSNKSRGIRLKRGVVRPGDEPLENDVEVEIIDVSEYEPRRILGGVYAFQFFLKSGLIWGQT